MGNRREPILDNKQIISYIYVLYRLSHLSLRDQACCLCIAQIHRLSADFLYQSNDDVIDQCPLRIALGGVANRSAARYIVEGTTVGRSARPVHADRSPNDWRFLLSRK